MKQFYYLYKKSNYKHTLLLIISIIIVFFISTTPWGHNAIVRFSHFGYWGAFLAGMFFVFTFTITPATIVLLSYAQTHDPLMVAILAGLGGVVGDFIILKIMRDNVFHELRPLFMNLGGKYLSRVIRSRYFSWLAPIFGAIIVMSPFPDEVGIGLMGVSHLKNWQFALLSFTLGSIGIFMIISIV